MLSAPKRLGERIRLGESPRAISGVPPENSVRRDAELHTRDAYAPQTYPETVASRCAFRKRFVRVA